MYSEQELFNTLAPGQKWRCTLKNELWHIRVIVDDQIVYKVWYKRRQSWIYRIESSFGFWLWYKDGYLVKE